MTTNFETCLKFASLVCLPEPVTQKSCAMKRTQEGDTVLSSKKQRMSQPSLHLLELPSELKSFIGLYLDSASEVALAHSCHQLKESCGEIAAGLIVPIEAARFGYTSLGKWLHSIGHSCDNLATLQAAAREGQLDFLKWVLDLFSKDTKRPLYVDTAFATAVEHNHLEVVKWLRSEGANLHDKHVGIAAKHGYKEMIICLRKMVPTAWPYKLFAKAARSGNTEFLAWLLESGCPFHINAYLNAAKLGHVNVLRWLGDNHNRGAIPPMYMWRYAARQKNLDVLEWMKEKNIPWDKRAYKDAVVNGRLEVLNWLNENRYERRGGLTYHAANKKKWDILKWLQENGCEWDDKTSCQLVNHGRFDLLKWAVSNGCPMDEELCALAAKEGHFEILKWARENGCPWNQHVCTCAASSGHFEILKWAHENGCPWNNRVAVVLARNSKSEHLRWAVENGCPLDASVAASVAEFGDLELLKFLRDHGCPWDRRTTTAAFRKKHTFVYHWACQNGCPTE